jgi:HK97 gp10 family phage protein
MLTISITGVAGVQKDIKNSLSSLMEDLADQVYANAQSNTPVKSGKARRAWQKKVTQENFEVSNKVPYIERLEAGASKQAPRGIIGPTLEQIKGKV